MWVKTSVLSAINSAIMERTGATTGYALSEMPTAILGIQTTSVGTKAITLNGTYRASDDGYDGYSTVTVSVPVESSTNPIEPYSIYDTTTTYIAASAYKSDSYLTSAVFTVATEVGSYAFIQCTSLLAVEMSRCVSIGFQAFTGCYSLRSVSLPLCRTIDGCAFNYCSSLSSVRLPSCTFIGHFAFGECSNLSYVSLPLCTRVGHDAFCYCSSLTSINLPACTSLDYGAFNGCTNITSISLPVCTSIGSYAFMGCYNLTSLYLTSVSQVPTVSENTFDHTPIGGYSTVAGQYGSVFVPSSLYGEFVVAPVWSLISSRITTIGGVPSSSSSQPVTPDGAYSIYDTTTTVIPSNAYLNDANLTKATFTMATDIGESAFAGCTALSRVELLSCSAIRSSAFYGCTSLSYVKLSMCGSYAEQGATWATGSIYTDAFYGCTNLMTLDMSRVRSKPRLASSAFANTPLEDSSYTGSYGSIYVEPFVDTAYTLSGNASNWWSLRARVTGNMPESVAPTYVAHDEPYSIYDSVATYIPSGMYYSDSYLTAITFTNVVSVGEGAFNECRNLSRVSLPNCEFIGSTRHVTGNATAFDYTSVSSIYLPKCSYVYGFNHCNSLATISLPVAEDVRGFDYCIARTLYLPSATFVTGFDVVYELSYLSMPEARYVQGFYDCNGLTTVSLPNAYNVECAFSSCRNLTTLRLPAAQGLGSNRLYSCYSLKNIYMPSAHDYDFDAVVFERTAGNYDVLTIHVPSDMLDGLNDRYSAYLPYVRFVAA